MESSLRHKEEGNRLFASKDISSAIASYRLGLLGLPPSDITNEEQTKCEVALRSNLALCLLRLTENPKKKLTEHQIREYLLEAERECTAALLLEPRNAKLLYRRGQSNVLMAYCDHKGKNGSADSRGCEELLSQAETDVKQCDELLNEQLDNLKQDKDVSKKIIKGVVQQIMEARKTLKRIESDRVKFGVDSNSSKSGGSSKADAEEHHESRLFRRSSSHKSGIMSHFKSSRSRKSSSSVTNGDNGNEAPNNGASPDPPPSPSEQKEQILQLLSRRQSPTDESGTIDTSETIFPPQKGEAYFLLDMAWWETWCRHVQFFHTYKGINEEQNNVLRRKIIEVDVANAKILQFLPPGATLPPYMEKEKKGVLSQNDKEDKKSDCSSSSEESSDASETEQPLAPAAIDNSSLNIIPNGNWCVPNVHIEEFDNISSKNNNDDSSLKSKSNESIFSLQSNLVRGYHFEILPRETYSALRSWYGEVSAPILRRAHSIDELPWLVNNKSSLLRASSNMAVRIALYEDRWGIMKQNQDVSVNSGNLSVCCACRAPFAKSKCTKCKCARYCNKDCQKSHWPYHKVQCWSLMKQKFQNEDLAAKKAIVPDHTLWGKVGLNNLGNTCYMSAAIHCMSHVTPLTRLFLSNQYLKNINENNINGTGGKVANAYGSLMKDLWMGSNQNGSLSPTVLKRAIELFAPQFYGVQQQDSAEFLSYLLDALHEDLNSIRNPPYVVLPEVDRGRKLTVCGAETWDALCLRNSSYVFENFYGMYKSTCVCSKCESVSVTFDTFNHITLEIPRVSKLDFVIVLFRDHGKDQPKLPVKYCVSVPQTATIYDFTAVLSSMSGVEASRLKICNVVVEKCSINQLYNEKTSVASLTNEDLLVAYEIAPIEDTTKINAVIIHKTEGTVFGLPLLISFDRNVLCSEVHHVLWEYVKPFVILGREEESDNSLIDELKSSLRIRVTDSSQQTPRMLRTGFDSQRTSILPVSNKKVADIIGLTDKEKYIFFSLEYSDVISITDNYDKTSQIYHGNFLMVTNHTSVAEYKNRVNRMHESDSVSLDQCFESFTQPERLDDDNKWYCSKCKEHVEAMKTVALWRLPNILIIHLKRFEYRNSFDRNKIGTLVDFPVDGFNMKKHSAYTSSTGSNEQSRIELVDEEAPNVYDLFGVTNHYGRMGYGHYTAYTRRFNEFEIEDGWREFDDENVVGVDANCIVSCSAYVLFYRKRDLL